MKLESVIMKTKLSDAIKRHRESKVELRNAKLNLDIIVRKGTYVREYFNEVSAVSLLHMIVYF